MAIKGATALKTKSSPTMGLADPAYKEQAKQFGEEKRKAGEEALGAINLLEQDIAQQEGEIAKAKYEQEKTKLAATQKAEEEYAGTTRGLYERAATLEEKYPFPTYKPTQEDALAYAQLGSMVVTLGMMLGGGAKASGKSALASMTGMINGWREGRQDLWRREAQQFDKDMQRIKSEREAIQKNLEKGLKLAATDRKAAQAYIDMAAHIAGQGVVQAMINKGRPVAALKHLQETFKFQQKTLEEIENRAIAQQRHEQLVNEQKAQRLATLQAKGRGLSAQQQSFEDMVSISINEAAAQVENLATMNFSTTGFWQGRNTKGLLDAPLGVLTNTLTTEDVQRYNAVIGILGREAAKVFAGGRIITDKAADDFSNQFKVREGDKPFTVLEKMANIRQYFERAIEVKQARPDVSPEMQKIYINALNSFKNSIPITNKEVNEAKRIYDASQGQSQKTFGQIMDEMGQPRPISSSNLDTNNIGETAKKAFGSYEPDKYDYRRDPQTGRMQRAKKE